MLRKLREEEGQANTEYGLIVILIGIALIVLLTILRSEVVDAYTTIITQLALT